MASLRPREAKLGHIHTAMLTYMLYCHCENCVELTPGWTEIFIKIDIMFFNLIKLI